MCVFEWMLYRTAPLLPKRRGVLAELWEAGWRKCALAGEVVTLNQVQNDSERSRGGDEEIPREALTCGGRRQ